jgi:hypothetical protein
LTIKRGYLGSIKDPALIIFMSIRYYFITDLYYPLVTTFLGVYTLFITSLKSSPPSNKKLSATPLYTRFGSIEVPLINLAEINPLYKLLYVTFICKFQL